jgi:hypothetical protein
MNSTGVFATPLPSASTTLTAKLPAKASTGPVGSGDETISMRAGGPAFGAEASEQLSAAARSMIAGVSRRVSQAPDAA